MAAMQLLLRRSFLAAPAEAGPVSIPDADREMWTGAVGELLSADAPASVKAALLTALAIRGESPDVIDVFREVLTRKAVACPLSGPCCDIVGTGGDGRNTFNISTPASIVAAAMGLTVAKHGNVSASAASGSADVVEHLGGVLALTPAQVAAVAARAGYCFIFAKAFHPELRHVGPLRKELGFRTVFNLMGPVLNMCEPEYMIVGVGAREKGEIIAGALARRANLRCLVVHSTDGLDKISPSVPTHSWLVEQGREPQYRLLTPSDFGLPTNGGGSSYYAGGGGPAENAAAIRRVLSGCGDSSLADFVLVQAAALAWIAGKAKDLAEGMSLGREVVRSGAAARVLDEYVRASTQEAKAKSTDILARIMRRRTVDLIVARAAVPEADLVARARSAPPTVCLRARVDQHGCSVGVLAEVKRASPSEGDINASADVCAQAAAYAAAGVQAVSVLTEPVWFKGSLDDMTRVRTALADSPTRPAILRKDFIFTKYQILEARAAGADSVLLIVATLDTIAAHGETLGGLIEFSRGLGMEPLVEVVTEEEVDAAVTAGARVIGVNNRDLKTFKVDLGRTGELVRYAREHHPSNDAVWIGLSGVSKLEHVEKMRDEGASAVLVGTTLMRSEDPALLIKEWQNPRKRAA